MSDEGSRPEDRVDFSSLEKLSEYAPPPKEPNELMPKILGTLAFLTVAAVVVAVPWYFLTRQQSPAAKPSPSGTSASPTVSASASPQPAAGTYEVVGVDHCVNVRLEPGTSSPQIDCLTLGVRVRADGQTEVFDGFTWLHIHDPFKKADGWIASQYLRRV